MYINDVQSPKEKDLKLIKKKVALNYNLHS